MIKVSLLTANIFFTASHQTWHKVNDLKVDYSGGLEEEKVEHNPRLEPCWSMVQLVYPKVAQPKSGALRPQVCLCWTVPYQVPSTKMFFRYSFWWYVRKRGTQTMTLIKLRSRCFKRIGRMQFYLRKNKLPDKWQVVIQNNGEYTID